MEKYLIYNHPAIPKDEIMMSKEYLLEDLLKKYSIDEIKIFFKPVNFKWEDLEATKKK